jgi:hypothetical protein
VSNNEPLSEQLRIAREEARDLRHRARLLRDALTFGKARKMAETGLSISAAKMNIEGSEWYEQAVRQLREAEEARDLAVARAYYLKDLLDDARDHNANRRAEMRL